MQGLRFSQWCLWWFKSSGMLHCVEWYIVTAFWRCYCLHFQGQAAREELGC